MELGLILIVIGIIVWLLLSYILGVLLIVIGLVLLLVPLIRSRY